MEIRINVEKKMLLEACYSHPNGREYLCRLCNAIEFSKERIESHMGQHTIDQLFESHSGDD